MRRALLGLFLSLLCNRLHAGLASDIERIAAQAHGRVGVACSLPGKSLDCNVNADAKLPMQSVYKLPIAVAVLHAVEQGKLSLPENVRFLPSDLISPGQHSPLRDRHPRGGAEVSIRELLRLAVENTGALLDAGASVQAVSCSKLFMGWLRPAVIDLLVQRGLDLNAVDENGRNQLHLALEPPVVPPVDGIEYLIHAGVPLNARDRFGKTPLAYWREPRDYERASFTTWLFHQLAGDSVLRQERENHAKISALLERAGVVL